MTDDKNQIIFVKLLDEGIDVWRPVPAEIIADGIFKILHVEDDFVLSESWEFKPGDAVFCSHKNLVGDNVLVATRLASLAGTP